MIQANSSINVNNQNFPAKSLFQVIKKKANPNAGDNPEVWLRVCEKSNSARQTPKIIQVSLDKLQNSDISILES
ncbi:MAG: serine/threonine protein phosphatase, partial [Dolichospermum sp.]